MPNGNRVSAANGPRLNKLAFRAPSLQGPGGFQATQHFEGW